LPCTKKPFSSSGLLVFFVFFSSWLLFVGVVFVVVGTLPCQFNEVCWSSLVVLALGFYPEGRGFESHRCKVRLRGLKWHPLVQLGVRRSSKTGGDWALTHVGGGDNALGLIQSKVGATTTSGDLNHKSSCSAELPLPRISVDTGGLVHWSELRSLVPWQRVRIRG
jgi:hypothetical protein